MKQKQDNISKKIGVKKHSKFKSVSLAVFLLSSFILFIFVAFWLKIVPSFKDLSLLQLFQAAAVEIQLIISPATPIAGTIFPAIIEKGDTVTVRITGQNFISGYDPVEKIILIPTGGGDIVYSAYTKVKNANALTATIDTSNIPLGSYDVKIVNQFMGKDITSTTYSSLSVALKTGTANDASFPVAHDELDSALDNSISETVAVANKGTGNDSLAITIPNSLVSDDSKILNLHIDSYDMDAYKTGAGNSGAKIPPDKGTLGHVYDIKFNTNTGESITSTNKPAELSFHYDPVIIAQERISPSTLKIYHWNSSSANWDVLDSQISLSQNTVSAAVSSFSPYTVMGDYLPSSGATGLGRGDPYSNSSGSIITPITDNEKGMAPSPSLIKVAQATLPNLTSNSADVLPGTNRFPLQITKILQFGTRNDQVKLLQLQLLRAGVYNGPVTGYFGNLTRNAVVAYQKNKNILEAGVVGPITISSLSTLPTKLNSVGEKSNDAIPLTRSNKQESIVKVVNAPTPDRSDKSKRGVLLNTISNTASYLWNFWKNILKYL